MGKLFVLTMRRGWVDSLGSDGSEASRSRRRARSEWMQACVRGLEMSCGRELRRRVSAEVKEEEQLAVVWVRRSAWSRVTDREEFVGRFSLESRLPQYLWW